VSSAAYNRLRLPSLLPILAPAPAPGALVLLQGRVCQAALDPPPPPSPGPKLASQRCVSCACVVLCLGAATMGLNKMGKEENLH